MRFSSARYIIPIAALLYGALVAADRYTVADIALYAYTHLAHECGYDLATFPEVRTWLDRMAHQPAHVRMDQQPADVAAE